MSEYTVQQLFNAKARTWGDKYAPQGPLTERLAAFVEQVQRCVLPPSTVLDLGCGSGDLAVKLAEAGYTVTACDIAEQMISSAQARFAESAVSWQWLPPDWESLPFEPGAFSTITASSIFEYVAAPETVLRECRRVVKQGGFLIFTVPNASHWIRKSEALVRPLAFTARRIPASTRLARYFAYLRLSRNRHASAEWQALGRAAGFSSYDCVDSRSPLALLRFRA